MSEEVETRWVRMETTDRRIAAKDRLACVRGGKVFLPGKIAGDPGRVHLCAAFDGVPIILSDGHAYYPAWWLKREYPDVAAQLASIESRIKAQVETEAADG